jgi:alpha-tubulin suppressor-like RCC1 family protein
VGWGWNNQGQLGDGTTRFAYLPEVVAERAELGGSPITSMATGFFHSLALTLDGKVWSWGLSEKGELGNGTTDRSLVPQLIDPDGTWAGQRVVAVAAGERHSVALTESGEVFCWGSNYLRQLGDGGWEDRLRPVRVDASGVLHNKVITKIAAGLGHTLALSADGALFVWGGYGPWKEGEWTSLVSAVPLPVAMGPLAGKSIVQMTGGLGFSLVLTSDGEMYAWGSNEHGKLGDTSGADRTTPGLVVLASAPAGTKVVAISVGWHHALALTAAGELYSWGYDYHGQLGLLYPLDPPPFNERATPTKINFGDQLDGDRIVAIEAGGLHSVAISQLGRVFAWGYNQSGEVGTGRYTHPYTPAKLPATGALCGERAIMLAKGPGTIHTLVITETSANGMPCLANIGAELRLRFSGEPGTLYELQQTANITPDPEWVAIGTGPADANGVATFKQPIPTSTSFWRAVPLAAP